MAKRKNKYGRALLQILSILLGNTILAFGVAAFIVPNNLISGGSTGLSLLFEHLLGVPITVTVCITNGVMFLLGLVLLGRRFAVTTLLSTIYYPVILGYFQTLPLESLGQDKLLSCLYAGLTVGAGVGLVLRMGASTGGMDIPPLILNRKLGLSLSLVMYGIDFVILLSQIPFSSAQEVLYGLLVVLLSSLTINQMLLLGKKQTQVLIISDEIGAINEKIQNRIDRGSTFIKAVTGYRQEERRILLTVLSHRELTPLTQLVHEIDPAAFLIVSQVNEVRGRGFTLDKHA